ncbi:hypothetical protein SS9_01812 [Enterococcus faecium EnGen0188]|nr:hypothetical protein [Enterococcus faecium]EOM62474.1 hypothetical protein SS9_01812 [Enterococcus faecium EnGen0188]MCD4988595.1 hypothetical protein [Enterococcus faecium]MCD5198280.1 hypothetical protein [Enterococcus faecium]MCV3191047.1 hypothetical protein [Enterococcus faecium]UQQ81270.1 hypothetical protein LQ058_05000 [Enterococcus faecium]
MTRRLKNSRPKFRSSSDWQIRVLVEIEDNQFVVIAIQVGHRRNVYD